VIKILWSPKDWENFSENPELAYHSSNRLRSTNNHETIKKQANITSKLLGIDIIDPDFNDFDCIIYQKYIHSRKKIHQAKKQKDKLLVLDICDPISKKETRSLNHRFDLIVCSSHELEDLLINNGLTVPSTTILDPHEADQSFIKEHKKTTKLKITWYGMSQNYPWCIAPLKSLLKDNDFEFQWTAEENNPHINEPGFQSGIEWNLCIENAHKIQKSWQRFIQSSDIGIVPVFNFVKSPHKILNYMAYGIPVICSPTDAHQRIITHGVNGFFASNEDEWKKHIIELKAPEVRSLIGKNARQHVLENFSVEKIANHYLEAIIENLQRKKSQTVFSSEKWKTYINQLSNKINKSLT
jgi:glycosyltransferase involved in cell wall biosynthesis